MAPDCNNNTSICPTSEISLASAEKVSIIYEFLQNTKLTSAENERNKNSPFLPPWVEPELIRKGQEFIQTHFFAVYFSHFISLLFLFCYEPIRLVLYRTKKSTPSAKSLRRYFSTLTHLKTWYEDDLFDQSSRASKDIQKIRQVHSSVASIITKHGQVLDQPNINLSSTALAAAVRNDFSQMNLKPEIDFSKLADNNNNDANVPVPVISQLDMLITQFCFMGMLSMYPKSFVINSTSDEDGLAGFLHLWALIGYRLGIEDEYNLCLNSTNLSSHEKKLIIQKVYLNSIATAEPSSYSSTQFLWESLVNGLSTFIPCLSVPALFTFTMNHVLNLNTTNKGNEVASLFSIYDKICLALMSSCFNSWLLNPILRTVLNNLLRLGIFIMSIRLRFSFINFKEQLTSWLKKRTEFLFKFVNEPDFNTIDTSRTQVM